MKRRITFGRLAALAALTGSAAIGAATGAQAAPVRAQASATTIIFDCGTKHQICTYNPTTRKKRTLAHGGYLAGITSNGKTYGYISATNGEIYEAPVAGGPTKLVNDQEQASPLAVMSSNGRYFLEQLLLAGTGQFVFEYDVKKGPKSDYTDIDSDTTDTLTYGFVGTTPLTAHSTSGFEPPSWVCIGHQTVNGFCGEGTTHPQIQSSRYNVTFPSGSPNRKLIAATVATSGNDVGWLALYSATTGKLVRTIARPKKGLVYSVPHFSPNGQQIVFEADPASGKGASSIYVVGVNGKGLQRIATGEYPFWGA